MSDVTREELRDMREDLVERMTQGFQGVHSRLDVLNGRVGKSEVALGEAGVRMTNVERELFRRPLLDGAKDAAPKDLASTPITFGTLDWLVKYGGWIALGTMGLFKLVGKL